MYVFLMIFLLVILHNTTLVMSTTGPSIDRSRERWETKT